MRCLNVALMIVSPRSPHSLRIPVVRHDIVEVSELFVADGADPALLDNLSVQKFPHFGG